MFFLLAAGRVGDIRKDFIGTKDNILCASLPECAAVFLLNFSKSH